MIQNEYRYNARFRAWVDEYCRQKNLTVEQALDTEEAERAFRHYTEV